MNLQRRICRSPTEESNRCEHADARDRTASSTRGLSRRTSIYSSEAVRPEKKG